MSSETFTIKPLEWKRVDGSDMEEVVGNKFYDYSLHRGGDHRGDDGNWYVNCYRVDDPQGDLHELLIATSPEEAKRLAEKHWQEYIGRALIAATPTPATDELHGLMEKVVALGCQRTMGKDGDVCAFYEKDVKDFCVACHAEVLLEATAPAADEPPNQCDYADILAGTLAVHYLDCTLVEFARELKYYADAEAQKINCDTGLIRLLQRAACVGWENIRLAARPISTPATDKSITLAALISVLRHMRSKHKTPNQWYEGWNAALDCLIHDAEAMIQQSPLPTFRTTKEAIEYAREHNLPGVVEVDAETLRMLALRKELDPDAPDAVVARGPQEKRCVECGHNNVDREGNCKHQIFHPKHLYGKYPIRYCGCKCMFSVTEGEAHHV